MSLNPKPLLTCPSCHRQYRPRRIGGWGFPQAVGILAFVATILVFEFVAIPWTHSLDIENHPGWKWLWNLLILQVIFGLYVSDILLGKILFDSVLGFIVGTVAFCIAPRPGAQPVEGCPSCGWSPQVDDLSVEESEAVEEAEKVEELEEIVSPGVMATPHVEGELPYAPEATRPSMLSSNERKWFFTVDGLELGPYAVEDLKQHVAKGALTPDMELHNKDRDILIYAGDVRDLFPRSTPNTPKGDDHV